MHVLGTPPAFVLSQDQTLIFLLENELFYRLALKLSLSYLKFIACELTSLLFGIFISRTLSAKLCSVFKVLPLPCDNFYIISCLLSFDKSFFSFSSLSNDSFIILSSFCSLDKLLALPPRSASCLPQTACITLQTLNQRKIKCSIKK